MHGARIGLALQGGGSYAAFTAGVLRGLLSGSEACLAPAQLHSISGTSGGALSAALLGLALHRGEPEPLRYLDAFWELNRLEALLKDRFQALKMVPDRVLAALIGVGREWAQQPALTAAGVNPRLKEVAWQVLGELLRRAVSELPAAVDQPLLAARSPYVTVAATEVRTATAHYFTSNSSMLSNYRRLEIARHRPILRELTLQGVYASLAHPLVFTPVTVGDCFYWDGYYTSNPPFMYLFREGCDEVVLVRLVQQHRPELEPGQASVRDRIEEIVQNGPVNMEILTFLAMREMVLGRSGASMTLGRGHFSRGAIFHEIRLLKAGNIADEGFPLTALVEKLNSLGEKVVGDPEGFARAYRGTPRGRQVVSEIDFESGEVRSHALDLDQLLFEERGLAQLAAQRRSAPAIVRFVRRLFG